MIDHRDTRPDPFDGGDQSLSSLYRQAPRPEPDAAVDEAILAASRRASRRAARPFGGRWQVPASLAAMLLVSVVLAPALFRQEQKARRAPEPQAQSRLESAAGRVDDRSEIKRMQAASPAGPRALEASIREALRAGDNSRAREMLDRLRADFPSYSIDSGLISRIEAQ